MWKKVKTRLFEELHISHVNMSVSKGATDRQRGTDLYVVPVKAGDIKSAVHTMWTAWYTTIVIDAILRRVFLLTFCGKQGNLIWCYLEVCLKSN